MDVAAIFTALAQHWLRAANNVANDELRTCYATRAEEYLELAAREGMRPGRRHSGERVDEQ